MQYLSPEEHAQFRAYKEKYPQALSFQHPIAPHNSSASGIHELSGFFNSSSSLKEMALEFQLEQFISQSQDLIREREYLSSSDFLASSSSTSSFSFSSSSSFSSPPNIEKDTLSLPSTISLEDLIKIREKRNETINAHSTPPDMNPCVMQADILRSEVIIEWEWMNSENKDNNGGNWIFFYLLFIVIF